MTKGIVFDICCRKGGATKGYQMRGLYVIGFDIEPQPGYIGDEFVQADGLDVLADLASLGYTMIRGVHVRPDLIHQSWPCQDGNTATACNRARGITDDHQQFIPSARRWSDMIGIPYVIEQPTSSRKDLIRRDLTLCMDMFKGDMPPPWVQKHRSFEISGFEVPQPEHPAGPVRGGCMAGFPKPAGHATRVRGWRAGVRYDGDYVAAYGNGGGKATAAEAAHAMQIDWMIDPERTERENAFDLYEAIPPAFTYHVGGAFLDSLRLL